MDLKTAILCQAIFETAKMMREVESHNFVAQFEHFGSLLETSLFDRDVLLQSPPVANSADAVGRVVALEMVMNSLQHLTAFSHHMLKKCGETDGNCTARAKFKKAMEGIVACLTTRQDELRSM